MKKIISSIFICTAITACMSKKIVFRHYETLDYKQTEKKYSLKVSKGYEYKGLKAGGEAGMEQQYWYKDSSVIYITDFGGTLNEMKIRNQEGAYSKRFMNDTASFSGTDEKGNYWKEIKNGKVLYGYANVPPEAKSVFDEALNSVRYK